MKSLLALAALFAATTVPAQVNLNFNGTVSTNCSLSVLQSGVLSVSPQSPNTMVTTGAGSDGVVSVSYIGTPTVSVTLPTAFTSSPTLGFTPSFSGTVFSSASGNLTVSNSIASLTYSSGNSDTLTVALGITTGSSTAFPLGNYSAVTTVTCS